MKNKSNKSGKVLIIILLILILLVAGAIVATKMNDNNSTPVAKGEEIKQEELPKPKVDIIDINSKTRPYALAVNNTPVAVQVQEGLNKAYLVYEIPTEGNTSRLLAFYKDIEEDLVVGTIRSARHNFVDFALESDAIFCCFGWSHYAKKDMQAGSIDYLQGLYGGPFYRKNPENLASEHTAYTSISKIDKAVKENKFKTTSNNTILLNYDPEDVDLSSAESVQVANTVVIPYGGYGNVTTFKYDEETKMYTRYEDDTKCKDHKTKEAVTTKNIIVQKLTYQVCDDNYYWDLNTIGSGEGYYITNGYAVPITWKKSSRSGKTKYSYKTGTIIDGKDVGGQEISVSDGRTYIEVQTTSQKLTIE